MCIQKPPIPPEKVALVFYRPMKLNAFPKTLRANVNVFGVPRNAISTVKSSPPFGGVAKVLPGAIISWCE